MDWTISPWRTRYVAVGPHCRWCRAVLPGGGTWCPWPAQCHAEEVEDRRAQAAKAKEGA